MVLPPSDHEPRTVLDRYSKSNRRLLELLHEADGLDVSRAKMVSPLAKWLKLRIGAAFAILAAHERRHLWQAGRVVAAEGFPGR